MRSPGNASALFALLVACVLASSGCTTHLAALRPDEPGARRQLVSDREATVRGLREGEIFVDRRASSSDGAFYHVSYVIETDVENAWYAAQNPSAWIEKTGEVERFRLLGGPRASEDEVRLSADVTWKNGREQRLDFRFDETTREVVVDVIGAGEAGAEVAEALIRMVPWERGSCLVEVAIKPHTTELERVFDTLLVPVSAMKQLTEGDRLRRVWGTFAQQHRLASTTTKIDEESGRRHVISIGVNFYEGNASGWPATVYAERDADAFFEWAEAAFPRFSPDEIRLTLKGAEASRARVLLELDNLIDSNRIRAGDSVLFFFAGHIDVARDRLGAGEQEFFPFLVLGDSERDNLRHTAIRREEVMDRLNALPCNRVVAFFDACYSGGVRARPLPPGSERWRTRGPVDFDLGFSTTDRKVALFAAVGPQGQALEDAAIKHGVFTASFLSAVRGGADRQGDNDGALSFAELQRYVEDKTNRDTDGRQQPWVSVPDDRRFRDVQWPVVDPSTAGD